MLKGRKDYAGWRGGILSSFERGKWRDRRTTWLDLQKGSWGAELKYREAPIQALFHRLWKGVRN